ncbi:hypothetical protein ACFSSA_15820 [Luteolibacter algae]|uniref:Uncharacterized protein n=1 Tax=Luteolibacter algae TaxID=454151 RepID=A0ABW5DBP4_9BACT
MTKRKKIAWILGIPALLICSLLAVYAFFYIRDTNIENAFKTLYVGQSVEEAEKLMSDAGGENSSFEKSVNRYNSTISLRQFVFYAEDGLISNKEILQSF